MKGSGVIITGGSPTPPEVVFPHSEKICPLPSLPFSSPVKLHTQDGLVLCGGSVDKRSCYTLSEKGWTKTHDLMGETITHVSWHTGSGILVMGGSSGQNTELG